MPQVLHVLGVGLTVGIVSVLAAAPMRAAAVGMIPAYQDAVAPDVFITELQTAGQTPGDEFIELYNNTDNDIDFADLANGGQRVWRLQFFGSTAFVSGLDWHRRPSATLSLTGVIPAHDYYLVASTGYAPGGIDADQTYVARMADIGGAVQLVDTAVAPAGAADAPPVTLTTAHDHLRWSGTADGTATPATTDNLPSPAAGGSLQRSTNSDGQYAGGDGLLMPVVSGVTVTPKDMWVLPPAAPPTVTPPPADGSPPPLAPPADVGSPPSSETAITPPNSGLNAPVVTELLPNPAEPLTDTADEFIELYNPNDSAFDLQNYRLETGTSTLHDFTFAAGLALPAHSYRAFYSRDTHLSLSNSGGQARLLDSTGATVSETAEYGAAAEGKTWDLAPDGTWQWSITLTPDAANIIAQPAVAAPAPSAAKAASAKRTVAAARPAHAASKRSVPSSKVKGAYTTRSSKTAKKPSGHAAATIPATNTADTLPRTPVHMTVLVAAVGGAVLYAAYEYRHDMANKLYQLRQYRAARRGDRK